MPRRARSVTRKCSRTVIPENSSRRWNVRPNPSRARWWTGQAGDVVAVEVRRVPASGRSMPSRQLKNVVLPAPFGPMSPTISPGWTSRSTPSRARDAREALRDPGRVEERRRVGRAAVEASGAALGHSAPPTGAGTGDAAAAAGVEFDLGLAEALGSALRLALVADRQLVDRALDARHGWSHTIVNTMATKPTGQPFGGLVGGDMRENR